MYVCIEAIYLAVITFIIKSKGNGCFAYTESFNSDFFMMNMHFIMRENYFPLENLDK